MGPIHLKGRSARPGSDSTTRMPVQRNCVFQVWCRGLSGTSVPLSTSTTVCPAPFRNEQVTRASARFSNVAAFCGLWNDMIDVEGSFAQTGRRQYSHRFSARWMTLPRCSGPSCGSRACLNARSGPQHESSRSSPPSLRLRDVPRRSRAFRNPACRAIRAAGSRRLWGDAAEPTRQAFRLQTEWSEAYARLSRRSSITRFKH